MANWPSNIVSLATALPPSPSDGQEISYVADATNGVTWHLRYNASSANSSKWEYIGGMELYTANDGVPAFTHTGGTGIAYSSVSCSVTAPLAGDYVISFGANQGSTNSPTYNVWLSPKIGATAAVDADGIRWNHGSAVPDEYHAMRKITKTGLSASTALALNARTDASSVTFTINLAWIAIRPIRVG